MFRSILFGMTLLCACLMSGKVSAQIDLGGAAVEVLLWESDSGSGNFHGDAPNEHVTLGLNNPAGASDMVLTFGLFDAGNDWWWAVDNIHVQGVPEPSALVLGIWAALLGLGAWRRRTR